jgi:hypothetical protein
VATHARHPLLGTACDVQLTGFQLQTDAIDSTSFRDGSPASFTVVIDREAPLGAKILLDYEGSKTFLPNLVAGVLAEYLRSCNAVPHFESYYLDDRFRPRPQDYAPVQTLLEWTLEEE